MARRSAVLVIALVGALVVVACRGTDVPAATQGPGQPTAGGQAAACRLLSVEDAAVVLGKGPMSSDGRGSPGFCTYVVVGTAEVLVSVYFKAEGGGSAWPSLKSSLIADSVPGLGSEALFEPGTTTLFVLKGDSYFTVRVFGRDLTATLNLDRQLAEIILRNL